MPLLWRLDWPWKPKLPEPELFSTLSFKELEVVKELQQLVVNLTRERDEWQRRAEHRERRLP
mgnify:CR=1 FL=1